jgi:hypothetical protein
MAARRYLFEPPGLRTMLPAEFAGEAVYHGDVVKLTAEQAAKVRGWYGETACIVLKSAPKAKAISADV